MKSFVLLAALTLGLSTNAVADTAVPADSNEVTQAQAPGGTNVNAELTPVQEERVTVTRSRSDAPLSGNSAWWVAGIVGAAVPLLLFALPALFLGVFGPFAPFAFLAAAVVATLATGLGGAVAWTIQAIFSDLKSGFMVPILGSAATGLAITFIGGTLATLVIASGVALAWVMSGAGSLGSLWETVRPDNINNVISRPEGPIVAAASTLGALTWAVTVVVGSIAGPLVGAYLYRANGEPKYVEEAVTVQQESRDMAPSRQPMQQPIQEPQPLPPGTYTVPDEPQLLPE